MQKDIIKYFRYVPKCCGNISFAHAGLFATSLSPSLSRSLSVTHSPSPTSPGLMRSCCSPNVAPIWGGGWVDGGREGEYACSPVRPSVALCARARSYVCARRALCAVVCCAACVCMHRLLRACGSLLLLLTRLRAPYARARFGGGGEGWSGRARTAPAPAAPSSPCACLVLSLSICLFIYIDTYVLMSKFTHKRHIHTEVHG